MDRQAFFEKSARHLLTQMKQSIFKSVCLYRSDDGCRCALGVHIPDDLYRPDMEGTFPGIPESRRTIDNQSENLANIMGLKTYEDCEFARHLQKIHDQNEPDRWLFRLMEFAFQHDLDGAFLKDYRYGRVTVS